MGTGVEKCDGTGVEVERAANRVGGGGVCNVTVS
jgi:hypothetical protein